MFNIKKLQLRVFINKLKDILVYKIYGKPNVTTNVVDVHIISIEIYITIKFVLNNKGLFCEWIKKSHKW